MYFSWNWSIRRLFRQLEQPLLNLSKHPSQSHSMLTSRSRRRISLYGKNVFSRIHVHIKYRELTPASADRSPTASRRRGRAVEWRPWIRWRRGAERLPDGRTFWPRSCGAKTSLENADPVSSQSRCVRWMLRTARRLRNMTRPCRCRRAEAALGGWLLFGSGQASRQK